MQRHSSLDRLTLPGYRVIAVRGELGVPAGTIGDARAFKRIDNGLAKGTVGFPV